MANVTPIYKGGCRTDPGNYRPISLTSIVCKILESIIRDKLMAYLDMNGLIAEEQHRFVPKKGCTSNLLEALDFVSGALASGESVDEILLDFVKAFDMAPHRRLVLKLKGYGIHEDLLNWFRDFLHEGKQRVVLGENVSEWADITSGVPQGSVLGPVLFVIYIYDLPERVKNKLKLHAVDSKILAVVNNTTEANHLQEDINYAVSWAIQWLKKFNVKKCKTIHYGRNIPIHHHFMIDGSETVSNLSSTDIERDLGEFFSSNLKWSEHVRVVTGRANKILGMLNKTFVSRDIELWRKLYIALVRPNLEFLAQVWSPYLAKDIVEVEKVQARATRIPWKLNDLPYQDRLKEFGLTSLSERRLRGDLLEIYKIVNELDKVNWIIEPC